MVYNRTTFFGKTGLIAIKGEDMANGNCGKKNARRAGNSTKRAKRAAKRIRNKEQPPAKGNFWCLSCLRRHSVRVIQCCFGEREGVCVSACIDIKAENKKSHWQQCCGCPACS